MAKRPGTLDAFIVPPPTKRQRAEPDSAAAPPEASKELSKHETYPWPVPHLPPGITNALHFAPSNEGRVINDEPDLDLIYYEPYVPKDSQRALFEFLRSELFFYRVKYNIKRGPVEQQIKTPRYTTVFGLDETSCFGDDGKIVDAVTKKAVGKDAYPSCKPRPIPECLDLLRRLTESATDCKFNFALVNYYASGDDSISYHSDDERFLGALPAIASFTLGAKRDFLLRHKKTGSGHPSESKPIKLPLASGDMILMKGKTQSCWEHSIPKRKGGDAGKGRINITFRRAMVRGGTANYYRYNVGDGIAFRWDENKREMVPWKKD